MKTYTYKGTGAGIPGLPHQITEEELKTLPEGLKRVFAAALAEGAYGESAGMESTHPEGPEKPQSRKTKAGPRPEGE